MELFVIILIGGAAHIIALIYFLFIREFSKKPKVEPDPEPMPEPAHPLGHDEAKEFIRYFFNLSKEDWEKFREVEKIIKPSCFINELDPQTKIKIKGIDAPWYVNYSLGVRITSTLCENGKIYDSRSIVYFNSDLTGSQLFDSLSLAMRPHLNFLAAGNAKTERQLIQFFIPQKDEFLKTKL